MNFKTKLYEQKKNTKVIENNYSNLSKEEIEMVEKFLKKHERKNIGPLTLNDISNLLQSKLITHIIFHCNVEIGHYVSDSMKHKINEKINNEDIEKIDLFVLLELVNEIKERMEKEEDIIDIEYGKYQIYMQKNYVKNS